MRCVDRDLRWIGLVIGFVLGSALFSAAADFNVTSPNVFAINGVNNNPTITLVRGRTYTFSLSTAPSHPFFIGTSVGSGAPPPGVSGNNGSSSGTITFSVPTNAQNCVYYCTVHFFSGNIVMVNPPTPPVPRIVSYSFGSNIVLRSFPATNTFTVFPEFKTNLNNTNWFALTVQSNRLVNGTNETFCGRPPGNDVFIRVRVQ